MKKIFHPGKYLLVDNIMLAQVGLCAMFTAFGMTYRTQRDEQCNQKLARRSWVVLESKYTVGNSSIERVMYDIGWLDKKLKAIICNYSTTLQVLQNRVSDVVIEMLSETDSILLRVFI